jgi:regulatory protein
MSETVVECKPRPRERVLIRLSGGRFFTIPAPAAQTLQPGTALEDGEIERLARLDEYVRGKDKAVRLLSIRARSRHELETALAGMDVSPAVRGGILEELREAGLVDDARFAREFTDSRVEFKHLGPHRLKFELRRFGVSPAIVERVLHESFPAGRQEALAWRIVRRKLGSRQPDEKDVRRINELLKRKGFDYGVASRIAYELLKRRGGAPEHESDEEPHGEDGG